ncbi:MAG: hypothetical protein GY861_13975 [bacterium]|nr:hypothetical protein [bacterium]
MRLIIDNDQYQLYARTDYALSEITLLNSSVTAGTTSFDVINASGFATDDYIIIEEIGKERAEIRQITVTGNSFAVAALTFAHDSKTKVSRLQYNQIRFYENSSVIDTVDITPDYYTKSKVDVNADNTYSIDYYNSTSTDASPEGEVLNGWEYNLCSIGDVLQYEDPSILGNKLIDKINLASSELRNMFISQDQEFADLSNRDIARLRQPVALRALYYIFTELIKKEDDVPSKKAKTYNTLYNDKLKEITDIINKENDKIRIWGQSRVLR